MLQSRTLYTKTSSTWVGDGRGGGTALPGQGTGGWGSLGAVIGAGGGVSSVSKCVIISPSKREDADIDYNFIQLAVEEPVAEWNNNCGNLSGAVGPYAVNTRIIKPQEGENKIRIYQVNTDKIIHSTFDVKDGIALTEGDYSIAGVSGTASKVRPNTYAITKVLEAVRRLSVEFYNVFLNHYKTSARM